MSRTSWSLSPISEADGMSDSLSGWTSAPELRKLIFLVPPPIILSFSEPACQL